jgi:hypothetical protein
MTATLCAVALHFCAAALRGIAVAVHAHSSPPLTDCPGPPSGTSLRNLPPEPPSRCSAARPLAGALPTGAAGRGRSSCSVQRVSLFRPAANACLALPRHLHITSAQAAQAQAPYVSSPATVIPSYIDHIHIPSTIIPTCHLQPPRPALPPQPFCWGSLAAGPTLRTPPRPRLARRLPRPPRRRLQGRVGGSRHLHLQPRGRLPAFEADT